MAPRKKICEFSGCGNTSDTYPEKPFFKFPLKNNKAWIKACKNEKLKEVTESSLCKNYYVCEDHFVNYDYGYILDHFKKRLKPGAVPKSPEALAQVNYSEYYTSSSDDEVLTPPPESVDQNALSSDTATSSASGAPKEVSSSTQQVLPEPPEKRKKTDADIDVSKSLQEQTASLHKVSDIAHGKNDILERYIDLVRVHHTNIGKLQKKNSEAHSEHWVHMQQQTKSLKEQMHRQREEMHHLMENIEIGWKNQNRETESMEQKIKDIQQKLEESHKAREAQLKQGNIQLEILDRLKKYVKS